MSAPGHARATALLCGAGLFATVLGLMAGIFGMHVMTASHALHSPATAAAAPASTQPESSPAGHPAGHDPGTASVPDVQAAPGDEGMRTVNCTASDDCPGMQSMTAACTPSAKTGSLAAPLPGTGVIARNITAGILSTISARWSYRPGSPSPDELCISRT